MAVIGVVIGGKPVRTAGEIQPRDLQVRGRPHRDPVLGYWLLPLPTVDPFVVAVTGSTGKTTTKDLMRAALEGHKRVVANQGSFNTLLDQVRAQIAWVKVVNRQIMPRVTVTVDQLAPTTAMTSPASGTTVAGSVTLTGPASSFPAVNSLTTNNGTFALAGGPAGAAMVAVALGVATWSGLSSLWPLYTLAAEYDRLALVVCTVSDHIVTGEETTSAEREQTFGAMIEIALTAALDD